MSGNYKHYDDCCEYHDKEKKDENCECKCIESLACALKKYKYRYVTVFEKDAFVIGEVKAVIDDSLLVLEYGFKCVDGLGYFPFKKIFISICKISEFIPYSYLTADAVSSKLKEAGATIVIEDENK